MYIYFYFQEALNEQGAGGSRGPIILAETEKHGRPYLAEEHGRKIDILFYFYCIY